MVTIHSASWPGLYNKNVVFGLKSIICLINVSTSYILRKRSLSTYFHHIQMCFTNPLRTYLNAPVMHVPAAYQNAVREQRLAQEVSAATRERDFYLSQVNRAKGIAAQEERKRKVPQCCMLARRTSPKESRPHASLSAPALSCFSAKMGSGQVLTQCPSLPPKETLACQLAGFHALHLHSSCWSSPGRRAADKPANQLLHAVSQTNI